MYQRARWRHKALAGLAVLVLFPLALAAWRAHLATRYNASINAAARQYGAIDPLLVRAVIWRESRFNACERGQAQERGLMQVTPAAALEWAKVSKIKNFDVDELFDPKTNIRAGTWYLARAIRRWSPQVDNPIPFALAEYNAGRSNALRWNDPLIPWSHAAFRLRIDFPTTRKYIETIEARYADYKKEGPESFGWRFCKELAAILSFND